MTTAPLPARACLPAPDLQSRLSFIDLCCILTEETTDKLLDLTTSYQQQPELHLTYHAIPRSQVAHLHSSIDALVGRFQHLRTLVDQQKTQQDDDEEEEEGTDQAQLQPPLAGVPLPERMTAEVEVEATEVEADKETTAAPLEEGRNKEDEAVSDKENDDSPDANRHSTPSSFRFSPHPLKRKATLSFNVSPAAAQPLSPPKRGASPAASSPQSSASPLQSTSSPVSPRRRSSLRTPSTPFTRAGSTPSSSASLPPTPSTPSLSLLGLSAATLQMLRLVPHPSGRTSTSSLESLDEEALKTRPELPSTLIIKRGRKVREEGGRGEGRLSVESERSEASGESPPVPAFESVLARTPHTSVRVSAQAMAGALTSPTSPLPPQHLTFDEAVTA